MSSKSSCETSALTSCAGEQPLANTLGKRIVTRQNRRSAAAILAPAARAVVIRHFDPMGGSNQDEIATSCPTWVSMVRRLTEPIDPKNLRMRPTLASADLISGRYSQDP